MDSLDELNDKFLRPDSDPALRMIAIHQLIGFTGSEEGCDLISKSIKLLTSLVDLLSAKKDESGFLICNILVNLSATVNGCNSILQVETKEDILSKLVQAISTLDNIADSAAKILSNLTHSSQGRNTVVPRLEPLEDNLKLLHKAFQNVSARTDSCNLDYVAMVFCNLSAHPSVRNILLEKNLLEELLPFVDFRESSIRRAGVVGTLKNCCFDVEKHEWLLKDLEILPQILLPLAGGETISDEENEKLPMELQYLETSKQREEEPSIRKDLLELLNKLCTSLYGREFLRENNAYVILREYHKWEKNKELLLACENVVDILIRTEEEIGRQDLVEGIEVPDDLVEKFKKMDEDFVND